MIVVTVAGQNFPRKSGKIGRIHRSFRPAAGEHGPGQARDNGIYITDRRLNVAEERCATNEAQHMRMRWLVSWLDSRAISHMQDMTADVFNNRALISWKIRTIIIIPGI
jgi:hypothetical protein